MTIRDCEERKRTSQEQESEWKDYGANWASTDYSNMEGEKKRVSDAVVVKEQRKRMQREKKRLEAVGLKEEKANVLTRISIQDRKCERSRGFHKRCIIRQRDPGLHES